MDVRGGASDGAGTRARAARWTRAARTSAGRRSGWLGRRLHHELVHVAPPPILAGLEALHDRVVRLVEVLRRVLVGRAVATPHVPALQTEPKMHPLRVHLQTLLAPVRRA